jgi:hypothetical protein
MAGNGVLQSKRRNRISSPQSLLLSADDVRSRVNTAQAQRGQRKDAAVNNHTNYWNQTAPGETFEHWRFGAGWDVGFSDALAFFSIRANGGLQGVVATGLGAWIFG